jgi:transcriptional regulator with XRE-family HTH domain
MIRNERELRETRARVEDFNAQIEVTRRQLAQQGALEEEIELATDPLHVLVAELSFDIRFYERLRSEGVSAVPSYPSEESGKELIALRIAKGWSQKQLAQALEVSEAQISRDERNDYQGITSERRARILQALAVEERRQFRAKRWEGVVIELPVRQLEAASFRGGVPTVCSATSTIQEDAECSPKSG